jgi:hypothetical protein
MQQIAMDFDAPAIETPAPFAPGSRSSELAALHIEPRRKGQHWTVLVALAALAADASLSREELHDITGIKESSLCARLSELRPFWVEAVEMARVASSGLSVDGYRLTTAGRNLVRKGAEP